MARLNRDKSDRTTNFTNNSKLCWFIWIDIILTIGLYLIILKEYYHVF